MADDIALGRVLQVNVSPGGVPKLPVAGPVRVGALGLDGDGHSERWHHGGPDRAVALFAIEAIRRVAAEGHPIYPGSCGENLTTEGVELSTLPIGTRLAIGGGLLLELSRPDSPCSTIRGSFADERFARISILTHPTDSRMYARVLSEGTVQAGDPIRVLEPAADSRAWALAMLARIDAARRKYWVANWRAGEAAGINIAIEDDGDLVMAACPAYPGPAVNQALGLELRPDLLPDSFAFFEAHAVDGWVQLDDRAVPDAVPTDDRHPVVILAIEPERVAAATVEGLRIRALEPSESAAAARLLLAADPVEGPTAERLLAMGPHLLGTPAQAARRLYVAELDGEPVATAALYTHRKVGWLAAAAVVEEARGRGIQRALIAHRAREAAEAGCDLVALDAAPDEISTRNAQRMGFLAVASRVLLPVEALPRPGGSGPGAADQFTS